MIKANIPKLICHRPGNNGLEPIPFFLSTAILFSFLFTSAADSDTVLDWDYPGFFLNFFFAADTSI